MGSPEDETDRRDNEHQHQVTMSKAFYMQTTEVTQAQFERVLERNPSRIKGKQLPVAQVSWEDAVEFCQKLSELPEEKAAGYRYRLSTEAEWEYACRAGTTTSFSFGDDESELRGYGWYKGNSRNMTHPVGEKKPNPWGLYDMHGNVWEWCQDRSGEYSSRDVTDPRGPSSGSSRVARGGCRNDDARLSRSAFRLSNPANNHSNINGIRVVCELD